MFRGTKLFLLMALLTLPLGRSFAEHCNNSAVEILTSKTMFADAEIPKGIIDGNNRVFWLAHVPNSVVVGHLNGQAIFATGTFVVHGRRVIMRSAPEHGDGLRFSYRFRKEAHR